VKEPQVRIALTFAAAGVVVGLALWAAMRMRAA